MTIRRWFYLDRRFDSWLANLFRWICFVTWLISLLQIVIVSILSILVQDYFFLVLWLVVGLVAAGVFVLIYRVVFSQALKFYNWKQL